MKSKSALELCEQMAEYDGEYCLFISLFSACIIIGIMFNEELMCLFVKTDKRHTHH